MDQKDGYGCVSNGWRMAPLCAGFLLVLLTAGCASTPVLYPNTHLKAVGDEQAERDIEACRQLAEEHVSSDRGEEVAGSTAVGAGVGAASGAVGGAVSGSPGTGAAIGAASGATAGFLRGLFYSGKPSRAYRNFVNRCLEERGYEPVGWD